MKLTDFFIKKYYNFLLRLTITTRNFNKNSAQNARINVYAAPFIPNTGIKINEEIKVTNKLSVPIIGCILKRRIPVIQYPINELENENMLANITLTNI